VPLYEQIGGAPVFRRLVDAFYAHIEADPVLRPLFPEDMGPGKEHQYLFLSQYFGGPATYTEQRGHPRLRMRHLPYAISTREATHWLTHMLAAIDETGIPEPHATTMRTYFRQAAAAMINRVAEERPAAARLDVPASGGDPA
jgi:hemoglobin